MSKFKLGIDLGGTKIEVLLLSPEGEQRLSKRISTPADNYQAILQAIQSLVSEAENICDEQLDVGIGIPGAISAKTGLLRNSNTVCMNGKPFLQDCESFLQRRVKIQNDANCFTLSEAVDGAADDYALVFGVIIGTGTGGGLVYRRQLLTGLHAIGGEWGHNPMPWQKADDILQTCYCGKMACIETFLSGPGMSSGFQQIHQSNPGSREIVRRSNQGDEVCQSFMGIYFDQMARALAHVINILDPDAIVLGGGMSNIDQIYHEIPDRLPDYVFSDYVATPILKARHGDASGVRGAAWLWTGEDGQI